MPGEYHSSQRQCASTDLYALNNGRVVRFAVDGERFDVRLAGSAWCGDDEWKLRIGQMYCDLVEEWPIQTQVIIRQLTIDFRALAGNVRSDHILGRHRIDRIETERAEDVPSARLPTVLVLRYAISEGSRAKLALTPESPRSVLL